MNNRSGFNRGARASILALALFSAATFTGTEDVRADGTFLCASGSLYSSSGRLVWLGDAACQEALDRSRDGFLCADGVLYSEEARLGYLGREECQNALDETRNGFTCADGSLYSHQGRLSYLGRAECRRALDSVI